MKSNVFVPLILVAFLAGSVLAFGQDSNEKKIDRIQKKIEKQTKKLQELTGEEAHAYTVMGSPMDEKEIQKMKEEVWAQSREAQAEALESIELQREAMADQKKEMEEKMIIIRKKNAEQMAKRNYMNPEKLKKLKEKQVEIWKDINGKKYHYYFNSPNFAYKVVEPTVIDMPEDIKVDIPEIHGGVYSFANISQDNLSIDKTLTEESSSADFNYEVKEGSTGMAVLVNGAIDSGKVKIVIKQPDGVLYNEYTLSSLANVNWRQSIKFEGKKGTEYVGKWTVTVSAEKAKGTYRVKLSAR